MPAYNWRVVGPFQGGTIRFQYGLLDGVPSVNLDAFYTLDPRSSRNWPPYGELVSSGQVSGLVAAGEPLAHKVVINVIQYLYFYGDHAHAADLATRAHADWNRRAGEADSQTLSAARYLGLCLWALGRYAEAEEVNQRVLELCRRQFPESPDTIIAELRVAVDLRTRGMFTVARKLNEQLYARAHERFTADHPITLQTAHDLAAVTRLCGDYRRSLEVNARTSETRARVFGEDSPDTLNTLSGVYVDRLELGEYQAALQGHALVANRVRETLGLAKDAPDMLRRCTYLAVAKRKAGDHAGALELSGRTLELYRRRYESLPHPSLLACAVGHVTDLRYAGRLDDARELGEQTVRQYRETLGENHPFTLAAIANYAVLQRITGDVAGARELNDRTLRKFQGALGADHPHAIACGINLGSDRAALGEIDSAVATGAAAIGRAERVLGPDHPITCAARQNLELDQLAGRRSGDEGSASGGERANIDVDPLPL